MTNDLLERYRETAKAHGSASERGDHREANACHSELTSLLRELRTMPDRGEGLLTQALGDPDGSVVCWAATHLLPLKEDRATAVLVRLSGQETGLAGLSAQMVLKEWEAGRLKVE